MNLEKNRFFVFSVILDGFESKKMKQKVGIWWETSDLSMPGSKVFSVLLVIKWSSKVDDVEVIVTGLVIRGKPALLDNMFKQSLAWEC